MKKDRDCEPVGGVSVSKPQPYADVIDIALTESETRVTHMHTSFASIR